MSTRRKSKQWTAAKDIPVVDGYDILVCGGGPAGIGAAVAAGRGGARTLLIERLNWVGGMGAGAARENWADTQNGSVFAELERRLTAIGKAKRRFDPQSHVNTMGRVAIHGETLKVAALQMVKEAGVDILFGAVVVGVKKEGDLVRGVIVGAKGGLFHVKAKVVVDATADGDVAAGAGAEYLKGDPGNGRLMHVNYYLKLKDVDLEKYEREKPSEETLLQWIGEALKSGKLHPPKGIFSPDAEFFPYHLPMRTLKLHYWEIEGVDCSDPFAVSKTLTDCQVASFEIVEFCRNRLPGYERCGIERVQDSLGVRESRRIVGQYTLTRDDVLSARKFDDGIAKACFFIDYHDSPPGQTVPYTLEFKKKFSPPQGDWYEIPYRCLLPKKVKGLLLAGRCVSADRDAFASLRVMATCMYTGEAAGAAAAMAVALKVSPHEVDGEKVRGKVVFD